MGKLADIFSRRKPLVYPIPPAPRTAVLIPGFRSRGRMRVFPQGWCADVARFAPQAIAGSLAQFEAIASTEMTLSHAIVVIGRREDARVTEADREKLWARFRVPVFEQIVGEDGALLAAECEAHCGLHIVGTGLRVSPDKTGTIDASPCGCGKTSPRFVPAEHAGARAAGL